ncbi:MAG: DUF5331 domain-containing protein [Scytonematopsis contorta HA4267-MV1]|jgi:hypothetical protein|nr:DUF5331 domain-containing protein [Scytonematopsis contorta HA4267-MV1]
MNTQQLRQSLKLKWINYYQTNRSWLVKMRIWGTYKGQRRPLSSFILATLSVLEPELTDMFPLILDLNNHPDEIIDALGLNFNPEEHLNTEKSETPTITNQPQGEIETLVPRPVSTPPPDVVTSHQVVNQVENQVENRGQLMPSVAIPVHFVNNGINKSKPSATVPPLVAESQKKTVDSTVIPDNFSNQSFSKQSHPNNGHSSNGYLNNGHSNHSHTNQNHLSNSRLNKSRSNHNLSGHSHIAQSVLVSIEEQSEGQLLDIETDKVAYEVNKSPIKASTIASWIDEFCQGSGWDKEEAVYIRF